MKRLLISILVVAAIATAGSMAWATIPDALSGVFHACVKKNGQVRLIDPVRETAAGRTRPAQAGPKPGLLVLRSAGGAGTTRACRARQEDDQRSRLDRRHREPGQRLCIGPKTAPGDYEITFPPRHLALAPRSAPLSPTGIPERPVATDPHGTPGDGSATVHVLTRSSDRQ